MAYEIGFVDNTGTEGSAHWQMLLKIKAVAEANGWTTLRYDNTLAVRELIMKGVGLSGTEEIFVGFRSYESVVSDYYNLSVAGFTGYVAGNTFAAQPGYIESGVPATSTRIDYWLVVNAQRIAFALKVGTPVYESAYVGKILPYATPTQFPYPLVVAGMLSGVPGTRFSDTAQAMPYRGNRTNCRLRFIDGSWLTPECAPWNNAMLMGGGTSGTDSRIWVTDAGYQLLRIVMTTSQGDFGEFDGIYQITGYGPNATENTLVIDGMTYVVIQDVYRNTFDSYYALRLS
jgi:hypothetical protein